MAAEHAQQRRRPLHLGAAFGLTRSLMPGRCTSLFIKVAGFYPPTCYCSRWPLKNHCYLLPASWPLHASRRRLPGPLAPPRQYARMPAAFCLTLPPWNDQGEVLKGTRGDPETICSACCRCRRRRRCPQQL
jgi:hypothetical protein